MKRQKTAFEKFFSWRRHQKRRGASTIGEQLHGVDLASLKQQLVVAPTPDDPNGLDATLINAPYRYRHFKDLSTHLTYLQREFVGQSALLFYHAKLIVLIRREADVQQHFAAFERLWQQQSDYLLQRLSLRWIVSAIDTFLDHSHDPAFNNLLMSALLLVNTAKLYETERHVHLDLPNRDQSNVANKQQTMDTFPPSYDLFGGIPPFTANKSDTLANMRARLDQLAKQTPLAGQIVLAVFARLHQYDTAYRRFARQHHKKRTQWW